jgi:hypothetical protein
VAQHDQAPLLARDRTSVVRPAAKSLVHLVQDTAHPLMLVGHAVGERVIDAGPAPELRPDQLVLGRVVVG